MRSSSPTSARRGTLSRIKVSSVRRLAIISGRVAFLAPEIGMVPWSGRPPTIRMRSMFQPPRPVPGPPDPSPTFPPGLRRKSGAVPISASAAATSSALRPRACSLRRLRFSRSAADNRALRAAHFSALPGLIMAAISKHAGGKCATNAVMAGLLPAIHVFGILGVEDVDARHIGERSDAVLRTASHQNEREMLERFIRDEPVLCNKTLAHITTQDFEAYRDKRLKTIKPSTLRRELNPLRTIFRIAKKNRHIPLTSPFDSLEVPKEDNERERLLSRDERDRL